MIGFKKRKDYTLVLEERTNFIFVLTELMEILIISKNEPQSIVIKNLIEVYTKNNFSQFVKLINGVEMWGGSGAVWEVYIQDKLKATEFEVGMLALIELMEKTKIIGKGIKPIKKIFQNNLRVQ